VPVSKNLANNIVGIDPNVQSIRLFLYTPGVPALRVNAPGFVPPPETADINTATFCIAEAWSRNNESGTMLGRFTIDKTPILLKDYYASTDPEAILREEFPPPPPPGN
jgi:hypothetical protein